MPRIFEELYNFLHLLFSTLLSCNVFERYVYAVAFLKEFGFALTNVEDAATSSAVATAAAEHPEPEKDDEQQGEDAR